MSSRACQTHALALVLEPEMLMYGEPTTGLVWRATRSVVEKSPAAAERYKVTSVGISYNMAPVFRSAERIAILAGGHL